MPRWRPYEPYFWSLVEKGPDCWEWKGGISKGYGRVCYGGIRAAAHRVAWMLTNGPIPDGLYACHKCDNRACVNPDHIFLGTQVDNMQDWTQKGKNRLVNEPSLWKRGDNHWTRKPQAKAWRKAQSEKMIAQGGVGR